MVDRAGNFDKITTPIDQILLGVELAIKSQLSN